MKINGNIYEDRQIANLAVSAELKCFLQEWFSSDEYVIGHTSGSTGTPKEVLLRKSDMIASAQLTNEYLGIDECSTLLLCLSPHYIAGKMMIVRALLANAMLYEVKPSSTPIAHFDKPVTLAAMVPMQVYETLQCVDGKAALSRISKLLVGGAPIAADMEKQLSQLPLQVYATYGMTETVSHIALRRVGTGDMVYEAIGDVTFELDNRDCLVINAPQLSCKRLVTNDVVALIDARHFIWQGRYDHVIISGGLKFCAEILEQKIATVLDRRYYVTSSPDMRLGEHIVLCIEGEPYDDKAMQQLHHSLSQVLSRYEQPREIRFVPRFEETYSGKIKRIKG